MRTVWLKLGGLTAVACLAVTAMGCDGDDDDGTNATTIVTAAAGTAVHMQGDVTLANGNLSKLTIYTTVAQERFDVSTAVATLTPPGGPAAPLTLTLTKPEKVSTDLAVQNEKKRTQSIDIDMTKTPTSAQGTYTLSITGGVTFTNEGTPKNASCKLKTITVTFMRTATQLLIPQGAASLGVTLPTSATTLNNGAAFLGLPVGTHVSSTLTAENGTILKKGDVVSNRDYQGKKQDAAVIADLKLGTLIGSNTGGTLTLDFKP